MTDKTVGFTLINGVFATHDFPGSVENAILCTR